MDFVIGGTCLMMGVFTFIMFMNKDIKLYGSCASMWTQETLNERKKYHDNRKGNTADRLLLLFLSFVFIFWGICSIFFPKITNYTC